MDHTHASPPSKWPLITAAGIGAFIASPYLLPYIGIGQPDYAAGAMTMLHSEGLGTGWVKSINELLNEVPIIGPDLALGGMTSVVTSGILGIGGVLLANWLENKEKASDFPWSKVIRYTALATSLFVALPSLLTSISMAATFLGLVHSSTVGNAGATFFANTLGGMGTMSTLTGGGNLLAVTIPHLLTCGAAIIPPALALFMSSKPKQHSHEAASTSADEPYEKTLWQERLKKVDKPPAHSALAR